MKDKNNCSYYTVLMHGTWRMKGHKKLYTFTSEQYEDVKGTYVLYLKNLEEPKINIPTSYKIYSENNSCFIILSGSKKFKMMDVIPKTETTELTMKNEQGEIFTYYKCKEMLF